MVINLFIKDIEKVDENKNFKRNEDLKNNEEVLFMKLNHGQKPDIEMINIKSISQNNEDKIPINQNKIDQEINSKVCNSFLIRKNQK